MTNVLTIPANTIVERRSPEEVLELPDSAPSRRGSTYWRRVLSCFREHLLANELGWARRHRSDALDFGLVWHYCLETYYKAVQLDQLGRGTENEASADTLAFRLLEKFAAEPGWQEGYETISRMLRKYFDEFDRLDRKMWEIVEVEATLEMPLAAGHGFEYTSRLDLFVREHATYGDRILRHVEHKSASALDQNTISGYTQDLQTIGQVWLATKLVDSAAYDAVYLGGIVNICTKAKDPKTARVPVQPGDGVLEAWEDSMRFWYRLRDTIETLEYPRNYASCVRRYGRCHYFDLCGSAPDVSPADLVQITRKARAGEGDLLSGYRFANQNDAEEFG